MNETERDAAWKRDTDARLRALEGGQRSGLSSIQQASGTAGLEITSFGVNDWQDDAGTTTPRVTLRTGTRVEIRAAWRPTFVGVPGTTVGVDDFRSSNVVIGVRIDSTDPQNFAPPTMRSNFVYAAHPGGFLHLPLTFLTGRDDLEPGEHTFELTWYALDSNPTGTVNPVMTDTYLSVFPLGFG